MTSRSGYPVGLVAAPEGVPVGQDFVSPLLPQTSRKQNFHEILGRECGQRRTQQRRQQKNRRRAEQSKQTMNRRRGGGNHIRGGGRGKEHRKYSNNSKTSNNSNNTTITSTTTKTTSTTIKTITTISAAHSRVQPHNRSKSTLTHKHLEHKDTILDKRQRAGRKLLVDI